MNSLISKNSEPEITIPVENAGPGHCVAGAGTGAVLPSLAVGCILVPFDFSDVSAALVRRLVPLAERTGAVLHLLHVVENADTWQPGSRASARRHEDPVVSVSKTMLDFWARRTVQNRVPVHTSLRIGRPAELIASRAASLKADLIVVATRGHRRVKQVFLGGTTEEVVRQAPCPVLAIPERALHTLGPECDGYPPSSWKRILMPVEYSAASRRALRHAAAIAIENRAQVHFIHVTSGQASSSADIDDANRKSVSEEKNRLRQWLKAELRWPLDSLASVWTQTPPLYAILTEAKVFDADLIVLPVRSSGWAKRLRQGRLTDGILRHAPCPVLCLNAKPGTALA